MVTTLELQRRGLPYAVVVDGAATTASLQALARQGLPCLVEVADGATMASRRALEARGLRYLVPVLVDATPASKASLAAQGLRYAVQVDADILPADRLVLQRQGLACYVEVDSSGNSVAAGAVGGAALLTGETNGFAADFTYATDAQRVAVKTGGTVVSSGLSFFTSAGTSSKWVYDVTGALVNIPAGTLPIDYDPVTHVAKGLLVEPQATNSLVDSNGFSTGWDTGAGLTKVKNATGPLGANTAWTLTMVAGTGTKWVFFNGPAGGNYRYSIYAKAGTLNWIAIGDGTASPTQAAFFNVSAGTVGTVAGRFSAATIQPVGNGWFRCSATVTGAVGFFDVQPHFADNEVAYWTATGGETAFVSAPQAEAGSVATSYIPTTSVATVTRAGDIVSIAPASINYSATAGSWWLDVSMNRSVTNDRIIGYDTSNYTAMYCVDATSFGLYYGSPLAKTVSSALGSHKLAVAFQNADRALTADGLAPATDAGSNLTTPGAHIGFGCQGDTGAYQMHGYIRKIRYLPRRPTNAELQTMTT